jgi:hypothetical protein
LNGKGLFTGALFVEGHAQFFSELLKPVFNRLTWKRFIQNKTPLDKQYPPLAKRNVF